MALQKTITLTSGVVIPDAYHRIEKLDVKVSGATCVATAQISSYINAAACLDKAPVRQKTYVMADFDKTAMGAAQIYLFLKSHPDYDGATDV
jgi:hypothetical protein